MSVLILNGLNFLIGANKSNFT